MIPDQRVLMSIVVENDRTASRISDRKEVPALLQVGIGRANNQLGNGLGKCVVTEHFPGLWSNIVDLCL